MKKLLFCLLAVSVLVLAACGGKTKADPNDLTRDMDRKIVMGYGRRKLGSRSPAALYL